MCRASQGHLRAFLISYLSNFLTWTCSTRPETLRPRWIGCRRLNFLTIVLKIGLDSIKNFLLHLPLSLFAFLVFSQGFLLALCAFNPPHYSARLDRVVAEIFQRVHFHVLTAQTIFMSSCCIHRRSQSRGPHYCLRPSLSDTPCRRRRRRNLLLSIASLHHDMV